MSQWVSSDKIEYFKRIEAATKGSENPNLDLIVMDYLGSIIDDIDAQDVIELGQKGIIRLNYKMNTEEGQRKNDDVIIANDGEYLMIIQSLNSLEEANNEDREKDELQIGIILDKIARIVDITIFEEENRFSLEQESFYADILKIAEEIERLKKEESATGIRKIFYGLKKFLVEEEINAKSMKPMLINKIIHLAKNTVGEESQKIYREKKEKKMRESAITHIVAPWTGRFIDELLNLDEERQRMEEQYEKRRNEITMAQHDNNQSEER